MRVPVLVPHQERVVAEERELDERLNRLSAFIHGHTFKTLDNEEQLLLQMQDDCMRTYIHILRKRIARFSGEPLAESPPKLRRGFLRG